MRILHLSALPIWPIEGKGGMPSLRETLRGHARAGCLLIVVLPAFDLFDETTRRVVVPDGEPYDVRIAPCRWVPAMNACRRLARRLGGGKEPPYILRWLINMSVFLLLTVSLMAAAIRLRFREKMRFDLAYAHNQYASLAGWLAARLLYRVPNVTRLYGTFLADLMRKPLVVLRYPVAAAGYLVPHSLLICANDGTRGDEVAKRLRIDASKFRFWQNGVDLPAEVPCTTRDELVSRFSATGLRADCSWVLSCSRLTYWKRIDRMIEAVHTAKEAGIDLQLLLVGAGPEEQRLRALAESRGVMSAIVWLGPVEHAAIWELMHVADAFMITNDVTNRCNPLFEAISATLPVITVRDPSTGDLVEHQDNALLAEKDDNEALGRNLIEVLSNREFSVQMRRSQEIRRKGLWSWTERMAAEVQELEQLVSRSGASLAPSA
jgi:glycosyltransferase involved in cell wall biosynthesis